MAETVQIKVLTRKMYAGRVFKEGEIEKATITPNGRAIPLGYKLATLQPEEYEIVIEDDVFAKLLDNGDAVC